MIIDIIKLLVEAPEKITRGVIACLRYLFAILFSITLYGWLYDKVGTDEITQWDFWQDWLSTGKVLIWIFLYVCSYRLLYSIITIVTVRPIQWLARRQWKTLKVDKELLTAILQTLSKFRLLKYEPQIERLSATRYTIEMIEFLEDIEEREPEEEEPIFSSYLHIWHLLVLFAAFYFGYGIRGAGHAILSFVIIVLITIFPIGYLIGMRVYHVLTDRKDELLFLIRGLEFDRKLETALRRQGCPLKEHTSEDGKLYWRTLFYQGMEYYYWLCWIRGKLTDKVISDIISGKVHGDRRLIVVTNGELGTGVKQMLELQEGRVAVLVIPSEEDVSAVIGEVFRIERPVKYLF